MLKIILHDTYLRLSNQQKIFAIYALTLASKKMSLDQNNVSAEFQLDWPANNRIIVGSLFPHFLGSLFSNFSKCWEIQIWLPRQVSIFRR